MSTFPHAAGWHPCFRSKIDVSLGSVLLLGILVGGAGTIGLLLQKGIASLAIIPLLATGSALWVLIETWYGVTDSDLIVHCGPFRAAVPIASIREIRPTRSVVSAPALSLDRLEVIHSDGALVISPADTAAFIRALRQRHPALDVAPVDVPLGGSRQERLLKWSWPVVTAALLMMTGATAIGGDKSRRIAGAILLFSICKTFVL